MNEVKKFYGKYRGTVVDNKDPERKGRIQVEVPDVLGLVPTTWAEACIPLTGPTGSPMGVFLLPPIGAAVWVEFEQGDPDYPIWVGGRWGSASNIPPKAYESTAPCPNIVIQSLGQHSLVISDMPGQTGGITIQSASGASIIVNDTGIYIKNGKGAGITLVGPQVTINEGALEII